MLSKLATQSFNILRLIARNPNFLRPKVPYFNVSRLSRLKMTQNGPKWPKVAQIWPQMAQNGPRMTQNDPKWPKNDPKWPKITPNGPKMTPGFTHFFRNFFYWKSGSANFFTFRMYGSCLLHIAKLSLTLSKDWVALFSLVCLFVCSSVRPHGNISIYLHCMMF